MSKMSEKIRTMFREGDEKRDAGLTTPDSIARVDNIQYGPDEQWQKMDLYRPKVRGNDVLPVIISFHGGGWVYGDKERYQYYCMSLAERGFAVVNFTYRLAPEFKFPAPMEDMNLVCTWILNNADQYRLDVDHIFAVGDSAGAQLLALYCDFLTNPACEALYDIEQPKGMKLQAVALNCGVYTFPEKFEENDLNGLLMKDFLNGGGTPEELKMINPIHHMCDDFTPCFVMSATGDFLQEQLPGMVAALISHHVPFEVHFYGDKTNQLPHVFQCNVRSEDAEQCNDQECAYFRRFCK